MKVLWLAWLCSSLLGGGYLGYMLFSEHTEKTAFVPGTMTNGHHQIETQCTTCHTDAFGGKDILQDACVQCHGAELKAVDDSHPKSKFTDPRNTDRLAKLDARYCITCHTEHRKEITDSMGVTLPGDFCQRCHENIAKDRPSHADMSFDTCASAGCHNFHDNKALYEDFLEKHLGEPSLLSTRLLPARDYLPLWQSVSHISTKPQTHPDRNASVDIIQDWLSTAHAKVGVNCSHCHSNEGSPVIEQVWTDQPPQAICADCHQVESEGFLAGRHGMRLAEGLTAMTPASARLPMKKDSHNKALTCTTCHSAHRFDTQAASIDACLGCHDDSHSQAYTQSVHYQLWQQEQTGDLPPGSGVSCATCHLPRITHRQSGIKRILVDHNQNNTLRPNEKMIRPVCLQCHGLGFSIDALADPQLIKNNFQGWPSHHIESLDMVQRRLNEQVAR